MNEKAASWAWGLHLPWRQKFVLVAIASDADDRGECRSSIERLADRCGMSRGSVARQVDWLAARELLQVDVLRAADDSSIKLPEEAIA